MTSSVPAAISYEYTGDGTTAAFSFPVKFLENADVEVYVENVLRVLTTQYTVSGAGGPSGGTVTFTAGYIPASGEAILLRRRTAPKQTVDLSDSGRTPGDTLEAQLDRLAMVAQDMKLSLDDLEELATGPAGADGADGIFSGSETIKTGAYQVVAADVGKTIILNKATADTLSFVAAATLGTTFMVLVKNIGAGTWTLDPDGAETIDGSASISLAQNESCIVTCNGSALRTIFLVPGLFAFLAAWSAASASGPAALSFAEDTDNGTNKVTLKAPASVASDVDVVLPGTADTLVGKATTDTLTNKRITPRVNTITSSATPTTNTDNYDFVNITALAAAITSMTTNLSGTPSIGDVLVFQIKDNGTARAITWGASFTAKGVALPTTTVISKLLTVCFIWNGSNWGCVGSAQEA